MSEKTAADLAAGVRMALTTKVSAPMVANAVAALDALVAQVDTLTRERDDLYEANWPWEWVIAGREKKRREAAEAALAEARDILRGFLHDADNGDRPGKGLRDMARRALAAVDEGGET